MLSACPILSGTVWGHACPILSGTEYRTCILLSNPDNFNDPKLFFKYSGSGCKLASFYGFIENIVETKASSDVQCHPNNPIFTDFLVCMDEEGLPKLVIEVKKSTFYPALIEITRVWSSDRRSLHIIHGE